MLLDRLSTADALAPLNPGFPAALGFLRRPDLATLPLGTIDVLPNKQVFAIVQAGPTKPREQGGWEAHRRYIDIQFVVDGVEQMGFAPLSRMREITPYDAAKDIAWFADVDQMGQFVNVTDGTFTIFFPWDVHMPSLQVGAPQHVRKIVMKVAVTPP